MSFNKLVSEVAKVFFENVPSELVVPKSGWEPGIELADLATFSQDSKTYAVLLERAKDVAKESAQQLTISYELKKDDHVPVPYNFPLSDGDRIKERATVVISRGAVAIRVANHGERMSILWMLKLKEKPKTEEEPSAQ